MAAADITMKMLRSFLAVAEGGSFGAAAGRLALSQATVSTRIGSMEAKVGVRLFERRGGRGGGAVLTGTGRALLPLAAEAVAAHDRLAAWLDGPRGPRRYW